MTLIKTALACAMAAVALVSLNAHAIDKNYARKLERSGCTQVSEAQGCDINKTKAENAKAGFGSAPSQPKSPSSSSAKYKDLAGKNSISAIDTMTERGFKSVDSFETGTTQYGIYYHPKSRTCVQLTMADGKVVAANDIKTHPKCHQ